MFIGITYDLREDYLKLGFSEEDTAEFDKMETIDGIQDALEAMGHRTERIGNLRSLIGRLASGKSWDFVFNICEGLYGVGREAQVPAVLDAYGIPYTFSDAAVLALSLHKGLTKRAVRDLGVLTPDFEVVTEERDIKNVRLPIPLFAKPAAEGTSKGIDAASRISSGAELETVCKRLLRKFKQPILVEEFLPGREFTAGIVGTGSKARVVGVMEVLSRGGADNPIYSYESKENYEQLVDYSKADEELSRMCSESALKVWTGLGCRDCGRVDFRMDAEGRLNFLEVNPLAGLNPVRSDLPIICRLHGISYSGLIGMIMDSALERLSKNI